MPIETVTIVNANLAGAAHDFRSVTEFKDLPRKIACLPTESNTLYGSGLDYWCQRGCGEEEFAYIVEPGDLIALQFKAPDRVNDNPLVPTIGWRETDPQYFVELEVVSLAGVVLWSGDTNVISDHFTIDVEDGTQYQNILVDVDRALAAAGNPACWYFRLKVFSAVAEFDVADDTRSFDGDPEEGYTYIDILNGGVKQWNGVAYVAVPIEFGDVWYDATGHLWYEWTSGGWVTLLEAPEAEEGAFDYLVTMQYRLRRCDERIVHFRSVDRGLDCLGFFHDTHRAAFQHDFKVKGEALIEQLPITLETTKNGRLVNRTSSRTVRVRTWPMPEAVAMRVQAVITSRLFHVNEEEYDIAESLRKNNDDGLMWWLDFTVGRDDCTTDVSCD